MIPSAAESELFRGCLERFLGVRSIKQRSTTSIDCWLNRPLDRRVQTEGYSWLTSWWLRYRLAKWLMARWQWDNLTVKQYWSSWDKSQPSIDFTSAAPRVVVSTVILNTDSQGLMVSPMGFDNQHCEPFANKNREVSSSLLNAIWLCYFVENQEIM